MNRFRVKEVHHGGDEYTFTLQVDDAARSWRCTLNDSVAEIKSAPGFLLLGARVKSARVSRGSRMKRDPFPRPRVSSDKPAIFLIDSAHRISDADLRSLLAILNTSL